MLGNSKLVLDTWCEVYDLLRPWADAEFWNLQNHVDQGQLIAGATYLIGREQTRINVPLIRELAMNGTVKIVFSNPAEGSETMVNHLKVMGIYDLVEQGRIVLIVGGDVPEHLPHLFYENFLPKVLDYKENIQAIDAYQQHSGRDRAYKFLYLNGRGRWHRKYLFDQLQDLLPQAIWTNLDTANGPIQLLPAQYEVPRFAKSLAVPDSGCVKTELFGQGIWGDIILYEAPYLDTYFSLVTETVNAIPYSFRTEKIWKPVAMGHPWIVAANQGYYRDMRNLGFKTFEHLIDESFDNITNEQDRIERIAEVVSDLLKQDLPSFLTAAEDVCKYNQQHLREAIKIARKQFPDRLSNFLSTYY